MGAGSKRGWGAVTEYLGLTLALSALCVFFGIRTDSFFQAGTFTTIANQSADAIILAVGMTCVLIIGGIDLSVGSVLALCGAVVGACMKTWGWPLPAAIGAGLSVGMLCGAVNGLVVVRWRIPSFIVTLGMMEVARGAAQLVTGSRTQYIGREIEVVTDTKFGGLTLAFYIAVLVMLLGHVVLLHTTFGRHALAAGANREAARLSGIRTDGVTVAVFVLSGFLAGLAAVIYTARLGGNADPNAGTGYELMAIAAAVIGGTSLMGGRGSVASSFLGVMIMAVLAYGLTLIDAKDPTKRVVTGCVIVLAVIIDYYRHRFGAPRLRAD